MSSVAEVRGLLDRAIEHLGTAQQQTSVSNDARANLVSSLALVRTETEQDIADLLRIADRLNGNAAILHAMSADAGDSGLQAAELGAYRAGDAAGWAMNALAQAFEGSSSQSLLNALASTESAKNSFDEASSAVIVMVNRIQEAAAMMANAKAQVQASVQQMPQDQLAQAVVTGDQAGASLEDGYRACTEAIEQAQVYSATL